MKTLTFYFKYAWRSIQRGGQRSFFAILCVAVGVGAIVALQTTGLSIQDTVAGDARANARADVLVSHRQRYFAPEDLTRFDTLKQNGTIVDYTTDNDNNGINVKKADGSPTNEFGSYYLTYIIEPAKFPFYGKVTLESPRAKAIKDVMTRPNQIVINSKMANSVGAKVGDKIKGEGYNGVAELEVVGILSGDTPSPGDGQAEFTGYGYINQETARPLFKVAEIQPSTMYVKTTSTIEADNKARDAIKALSPLYDAQTSTERNDQIKQASKGLSDLLSYVGLISLLIGSVGVVNTMLVVVGRRSTEIATIKALGMESGQTVRVFLVESAILGVIGSIVGVVLGLFLSVAISSAAEGFISRQLSFSIYLQPIVIGLVVGIVTAIAFGLLPAYSASKIPPAQVLRQKINNLPRISFWATLLIILAMTLIMGTLAGIILNGQFLLGIAVAFGTLVACTVLVLLFAGILWLVGKIPLPFGLNYKMARRNLSRGRAKNAVTMLVMMVGIFSVALVFILASSLKDTVKSLLEQSFGYNIQFLTRDDAQLAAYKQSDVKLIPGFEKQVQISRASARMVSGGGASVQELYVRKLQKDQERNAGGQAGQQQGQGAGSTTFSLLIGIAPDDYGSILKVKQGSLYNKPGDVTIDKSLQNDFGLNIGDKLVYQNLINDSQSTLTITGIHETKSVLFGLVPVAGNNELLQSIPGYITAFNLTINNSKVGEAEKYLKQQYAGSNVTNLSFITVVFNRLIDQFTAFPVLLAFLSLIAGAVLIANNVALAVLERRTEMGVMKSIGADSGRVLSIINLETSIVALLGGVIGLLGASGLASALIGVFGTPENPAVLSISPAITLGMLVLSVVLALFATIASAWGAANEKPMVVLRYE